MIEEEFSLLRRESENFFKNCVEAIFCELGLPAKEFAYQVKLWDHMGQYEEGSHFCACNLFADIYGGPSSLPIEAKAALLYEPGDMYWQAARVIFFLPQGRPWSFTCYREDGRVQVKTDDPPRACA